MNGDEGGGVVGGRLRCLIPIKGGPKIWDEPFSVHCEPIEGERESERKRAREGEGGGRRVCCYFRLGVVMETAASLQMEMSRTHVSSEK